jgi:hypothetical protein
MNDGRETVPLRVSPTIGASIVPGAADRHPVVREGRSSVP